MQFIFLSYYVAVAFKGKQRGMQIVLASVFMLIGLLMLGGVIRYLGGSYFTPKDFFQAAGFLYFLFNLLFAILVKPETASVLAVGENVTLVKAQQAENAPLVDDGGFKFKGKDYSKETAERPAPTRKVADSVEPTKGAE